MTSPGILPDSVGLILNGLNPNSANHDATELSTLGYTDLEVYLHELSAVRTTAVAIEQLSGATTSIIT